MQKNVLNGNDVPYTGFLQVYDNAKTRENYSAALQKFLRFVSCGDVSVPLTGMSGAAEVGVLRDGLYDAFARVYFDELAEGRNYVHDLMLFTSSLTGRYAPATVRLTLQTVMLWFEDNGAGINRQAKKRVLKIVPRTYSVRRESDLTRSLFRNVYVQMSREWARVLLVVMLSTGLRLGEALSLRESDVVRGRSRVMLRVRAETCKTKSERFVFLTREAADVLERYLVGRRAEGFVRCVSSGVSGSVCCEVSGGVSCSGSGAVRHYFRRESDDVIFPYSKAACERQMRVAADRAGYGRKDGALRSVHWHMTRKWFISRVSLYAGAAAAEELAGHEGYLSRAYRRFTSRQLLAQFLKAEQYLVLFPECCGADSCRRVCGGVSEAEAADF